MKEKKKTHYVLIFISLNITPQIRCILKNHIKLIKAQLFSRWWPFSVFFRKQTVTYADHTAYNYTVSTG